MFSDEEKSKFESDGVPVPDDFVETCPDTWAKKGNKCKQCEIGSYSSSSGDDCLSCPGSKASMPGVKGANNCFER